MRREDESKIVVLPVRMPVTLYEELSILALSDEGNRCQCVRKLIRDEVRRAARRMKTNGHGKPEPTSIAK